MPKVYRGVTRCLFGMTKPRGLCLAMHLGACSPYLRNQD